jgi:hypothetical protein
LQIVNGGQTTASIFNTARKEKVDISQIFVQVKFSIIENPKQYNEIVSEISRSFSLELVRAEPFQFYQSTAKYHVCIRAVFHIPKPLKHSNPEP